MKKFILLMIMTLFVASVSANEELGTPLSLNVSYVDPTIPTTPILRMPPIRLSVYQNKNTLNFRNLYANYVLTINDYNGSPLYTTYVAQGSNSCILPYDLQGFSK